MKDEIKEILDGFKEILDNPTTSDECYDGRIIVIDRSYDLDLDEIKLLLDYITNLQEELKETADLCSKHFVKIQTLKTNIKELQEENEFLKLSNPEMNLEHSRVVNENKRKINNLRKHNKQLQNQLQQKENIIKEVREYIENNSYFKDNVVKTMIFKDYSNGILEILDKEKKA